MINNVPEERLQHKNKYHFPKHLQIKTTILWEVLLTLEQYTTFNSLKQTMSINLHITALLCLLKFQPWIFLLKNAIFSVVKASNVTFVEIFSEAYSHTFSD